MLLRFDTFAEIDLPKLMEIYRESNEENAPTFFPDCIDPDEGRRLVEKRFGAYLREDFFAQPGNRYYVLEEGGRWLCAIRLFPVPGQEGAYYAEALETRPDSRRQGAAARLFRGIFDELSKEGSFEITDSVSKKNEASLRCHEACGFAIFQEEALCVLDGYRNPRSYGLKYRQEAQKENEDPHENA